MKNGILREDEGFDILINGVPRTFRDVEAVAFEAARYAKQRNRGDVVELRNRATGAKLLRATFVAKAMVAQTIHHVDITSPQPDRLQ